MYAWTKIIALVLLVLDRDYRGQLLLAIPRLSLAREYL